MRYLSLLVSMVRYPAAIVLVLFYVLSVTLHDQPTGFRLDYLFSVLTLVAGYACATTVNDILDKDIDLINHAKRRGRPLVSGVGSVRDLTIIYSIALVLSGIFAAEVSLNAFVLMIAYQLMGLLYSIPPVQISHRTHIAPIFLTSMYVGVPYTLGIISTQSSFQSFDWFLLSGLLFVFFGRVALKDFRDRTGDAAGGKVTPVLRYGKEPICKLAILSILVGNILLFTALPIHPLPLALTEIYFLAIFYILLKLRQTKGLPGELRLIALAAMFGNGFLLTVVTLLLFEQLAAPLTVQVIAEVILMGLYAKRLQIVFPKWHNALAG